MCVCNSSVDLINVWTWQKHFAYSETLAWETWPKTISHSGFFWLLFFIILSPLCSFRLVTSYLSGWLCFRKIFWKQPYRKKGKNCVKKCYIWNNIMRACCMWLFETNCWCNWLCWCNFASRIRPNTLLNHQRKHDFDLERLYHSRDREKKPEVQSL